MFKYVFPCIGAMKGMVKGREKMSIYFVFRRWKRLVDILFMAMMMIIIIIMMALDGGGCWMLVVDAIVRELFLPVHFADVPTNTRRTKKSHKRFSHYSFFGSCDEPTAMELCNFYNLHKCTLQTNTIFVYWVVGAWVFCCCYFCLLAFGCPHFAS